MQPDDSPATTALESRLATLGRVFILALALGVLACLPMLAGGSGGVPGFGGDFSAFWSAGRLALEGRPLAAFDPDTLLELERQAAGIGDVLLWHYPPTWHLAVTPFARLSYPVALVLFLALSLGLWAAALRRLGGPLPGPVFAAFALAPAVWITVGQGQNGLLTGALACLALAGMREGRTGWIALGAGLLVIKPHLGLLLPVALLASGQVRETAAAAAVAVAGIAVSLAAFGPEYWRMLAADGPALGAAMWSGDLWDQQVTPFAALARAGLAPGAALAVHLVLAVGLVALVWRLWRFGGAFEPRAAALLLATPLLPPYAFHYDLCTTAAALLLLYRHIRRTGAGRAELAVLSALFLAPPFHRPLSEALGIGVMAPLLLLGLWVCWRRAHSAVDPRDVLDGETSEVGSTA
ncbi:glycosyltransferase family 87 protein [Oceaniglobus roseus]|uniref:glycosyltransferase family 87 protein n=1 Tax=Oceaniglobus roseus TaxID=1737570 RepID=UPI000C7F4654|nr:glycosyltransferase family 87 protein [Kandeliimicrobium roseum]